jgi:PAS domain S-box-containing protein
MTKDTPPRDPPGHDAPEPPENGEGKARDARGSNGSDRAGHPGAEATSADFYRLLVESVQDYAIFALDRTGRVLTWSAGAARLKGYARTEIIGRHFSAFYPPEDVAAGKPDRELDVAARTGRLEDEGWRVRQDGTRFWASVVITALRDEMGALVGFAKVTRDLTERRQTEDALRRSEERFRLLVESVRDYAIFMLDPEGYVATWNAGAERIKGYRAEEIVGKHFSVFYPEEKVASGFPQYELEVAAREGRFEDEDWRIRKDGTRFWANVIITALRGRDGNLVGFAKVTRDLTERRAAEEQARYLAAEQAARAEAERRSEELRQLSEQLQDQAVELEQQTEEAQLLAEQLEHANEELQRALSDANVARAEAEAASRAKSEFLATMSHELRTPLNAIGGYAQLIDMGLRGPVTPEQREDLERIRRSQLHLTGLIDEVLSYARLGSGGVTYDLRPTLVADVVAAAVSLVEPQRAAKRLALDVRLPEFAGRPPLYVLADRDKLQQVLLDLLSNAVRFTPEGGTVTVESLSEPDERGMAVLQVRDTGIGIPADKLESIFDPFVQLGRPLSSPGEGTGLGLAISRDLARGMGGDLTADSTPSAGSTFTLTLPVA